MLVLTRKKDQEIIIDGDIRLSILSAGKSRVRIGIDAPRHVSIQRGEAQVDGPRVPEDSLLK